MTAASVTLCCLLAVSLSSVRNTCAAAGGAAAPVVRICVALQQDNSADGVQRMQSSFTVDATPGIPFCVGVCSYPGGAPTRYPGSYQQEITVLGLTAHGWLIQYVLRDPWAHVRGLDRKRYFLLTERPLRIDECPEANEPERRGAMILRICKIDETVHSSLGVSRPQSAVSADYLRSPAN
jgi:hypothetical protein